MFILEFDSRSDGGPLRVGPFADRGLAEAHAAGLGGTLSYSVVPLTPPEGDQECPFCPGRRRCVQCTASRGGIEYLLAGG